MSGASPYIEDDETIYSFCAIAHAWSGSIRADFTAIRLTGTATGARHHDLPLSLRDLPLAQARRQDSAFRWATAHTIAAFYVPFISRTPRRLADATWFTGGPKARSRDSNRPPFELVRRKRRRAHRSSVLACRSSISDDLVVCVEHARPAMDTSTTLILAAGENSESIAEAGRIEAEFVRVAVLLATLCEAVRSASEINCVGLVEASEHRLRTLGLLGIASDFLREPAGGLVLLYGSLSVPPRAPAWTTSHSRWSWISRHLRGLVRTHPVHSLLLWCAMDWASTERATSAFRDAMQKRPNPFSSICGEPGEHVAAAFPADPGHVRVARQLPKGRRALLRCATSGGSDQLSS